MEGEQRRGEGTEVKGMRKCEREERKERGREGEG